MQFVQAAQFDRLGVFSYSDEDTSRSFELDGKVDARTIYNRKRRLMAMQRKISRRRNRAHGRAPRCRCWWRASRRRPICCGKARMPTQAPEIDGVTLINDFEGAEPRPGEMRHAADHRSARLRSGGNAAGRSRDGPGALERRLEPCLDQHLGMKHEVSDLQEGSQTGRSRFPVLQRALPDSSIWATGRPRST